MIRILSIAFCLLFSLCITAQDKLITNTRMIGVGYSSIQDTYLSPLHYNGTEVRYLSHTLRENDSTRWSRLIINEGYASKGETRSGSRTMYGGAYHFQYGVLRNFHPAQTEKLSLAVGLQAEALAGILYINNGSNNPAQARALLDVGPVARASYPLGRMLTISYEASCPLLGLTFSPNYAQSYYEIAEGNTDGNLVVTTVVSTPSLRHQLMASIRLSRLTLTVGYLGDYRQQQVNNLKQHVYSHMFMLGLQRSFYAGRRLR